MRRKNLLYVSLFLAVFFPGLVAAQGEYLLGTESGGGVGLGASIHDGNFQASVEGGFCFSGLLDLSTGGGIANQEKGGYFGGSSSHAFFSAEGTLWAIKEGRHNSKASLGLFVGGVSMESNSAVTIGGLISKQARVSADRTLLVTTIGIGQMKVDGWQPWETTGFLSLGLAFPMRENSKFTISANTTLASGASSVGVQMSFVFKAAKKSEF